jgi:inner membrane protein
MFSGMDNVAHTLVGAVVGRAVGGARVPRAGLLGIVAANTPDVAELLTVAPWPRVQHLALHRGLTHAIVGVAVEIAVLALGAALLYRWLARRRGAAPPAAGWVLAVTAAAMVTHPVMDWQGSYGLRPFLPWDGTWYYGDFVAIVDVWYWLVPLIALAWGEWRHWLPLALYAALWLPTTAAVLLLDAPAGWIKIGWSAASVVALVGWVRHWLGPARAQLAAAVAVAALFCYAAAQGVASVPVKAALRRDAMARFGPEATWAALTIPGRPFVWRRLLAGPDSVAGDGWALPRHLDHPLVRRSLTETAAGRAMTAFARFLAAEVDSGPRPPVVRLRDVRYAAPGEDGWASVTVRLDE